MDVDVERETTCCSYTRRCGKYCTFNCTCDFSILGLVLFVMILVIHFTTKAPRFYLSHLHLPSSPPAGNLTYQLQIRNMAKLLGVRYDDLVFSALDGGNVGFNASATVPGFYQGHRKRKEVDGELEGGWTAAGRNGTSAKLVVVGLEGSFRYRAGKLWKSKRHGVRVGGNFVVNATTGDGVAEEWIQLLNVYEPPPPPSSSAAAALRRCCWWNGGGGVFGGLSVMAVTMLSLVI